MGKLIFFDIDGTLWDERMVIPGSAVEALHRLQGNGHKIFLCSGRARGNIRSKELLDIGFDGIVAACGCHIEIGGEIVCEHILSPELTERVVNLLRECHMPVVLEGPEFHWIDKDGFDDDPYVNYLFEEMGKSAKVLEGYTSDIRVNKFSADVLADTDYDRIKRELGDEFNFLEHEGNVVEFAPKGFSKATGIEWVRKFFGVPIGDTYAVGDSVNDLDMLSFVGHGIAMGNATQPAKDAAEFVTSDIHDDGIKRAMEHYGLI
ncbi:MAG: HAD-IIB family hydrolase [Clostridiales bacterium]|nr:HAD-IIB family hydrolase [Clostridiales bacterium]